MVDTTELAAPLARLWRDVYRKAAEVAERRTTEQLKTHVYVYHPSGAGGAEEGPYVDEAGDTMTGPLIHQGAALDANVVQARLAADTQPRYRMDASGRMEWSPDGVTPPDVALERGGGGLVLAGDFQPDGPVAFRLGTPSAYWEYAHVAHVRTNDGGSLGVGATGIANAGSLRLVNGTAGAIAWRNAANLADHTLTVNTSDQLVFDGVPIGGGGGGGTGNTTMYTQTTAPAGATNSLWFNPNESA